MAPEVPHAGRAGGRDARRQNLAGRRGAAGCGSSRGNETILNREARDSLLFALGKAWAQYKKYK